MYTEPIFLESLLSSGAGNFIVKMLVNTLAVFIAAKVLSGIRVNNLKTALFVAIVVALLNVTLGSYLAELTGLDIGILSFVIDAIVLLVASWLLEGFKINGFLWAIVLAVVLALLNGFLFRVLGNL